MIFVPFQFQENPNGSSLSAEAIILPYKLFLSGGNGDGQPLKFHQGNLKSSLHYPETKDDTQKVGFKRQKIAHLQNGALLCSSGKVLQVVGEGKYELQSKKPPIILCSPSEIPCFIAVRSDNNEGLPVPGILFCVNSDAVDNVVDKPSAQKVLLEFSSESFNMYQVEILIFLALSHSVVKSCM